MESTTNAGSAAPLSAVSVSLSQEDVVANLSMAENPVLSFPVLSFLAVVAEKNVSAVAIPLQDENPLPNCPLTTFFMPPMYFTL